MTQENSSQMRQIQEEAQYFQNIQSPSYELQKDLFVSQHHHQLSKNQLQKLMKGIQSHNKEDAFKGKNSNKDVYSLLTPLPAFEEFQLFESQNESSLDQEQVLMKYKEKQKNLLDQILLPFSLIQGKCYYELHPEKFHSKDLMKTFEQDSHQNSEEILEPVQNEKEKVVKQNQIKKQMKDLAKLISSYQNFNQSLDISANFHRIKYGQQLPKIYQSMLWIMKKEGKKMENALEEQINNLKQNISQLEKPAQYVSQFNPFVQNFNSQRLDQIQLIRESASQNGSSKKSKAQNPNGQKFECFQ